MALIDDRGRVVSLPQPPRRIVSLVPSDTYSLFQLGVGDRVVGRTDYCVEPAADVGAVASVGGTKNPRLNDIFALQPDLVLTNQEENTEKDVLALIQAGLTVWVAFPKRVADGLSHLARLARLVGAEREPRVKELIRKGYQTIREAEALRATGEPLRAFVPIWMDPLMTIHADTFLSDMLDLAGAHNVFADRSRRYPLAADLGRQAPLPLAKTIGRDTRYPRITLDEVVERAPDVILLPDEPHAFSQSDAEVFRNTATPAARYGTVVFCQGKDLCWPGAQSIEGIPRLRVLLEELRSGIAHNRPKKDLV